jgi:hypothetical protein
MSFPNPSIPLVALVGIAFSGSQKAEALPKSLLSEFQPVNGLSEPAVIEMVEEAFQAYPFAPSSEPLLTNHSKVLDTIRDETVGKAPGPNSVTNKDLKHFPQMAVSTV